MDDRISDVFNRFEIALGQPKDPFYWPVLATVSPDGFPHLRTVVLRDHHEGGLTVFSDARTQKIRDHRNFPRASLLFYDPDERFQVRASGTSHLHIRDAVSAGYWEKLSNKQKAEYQSAGEPGEAYDAGSIAVDPVMGDKNFAVLRVRMDKVDTLYIKKDGHLRHRFQLVDGVWTGWRIVP